MLENINLNYLKIYHQVVKCENISKASALLHISQPAITQTINKLEESLNVQLLIRNKKGVVPTKIGKEIFEFSDRIIQSLNSISTIINLDCEIAHGSLQIGCGTNIAKSILSLPISNFVKDYPKIQIFHKDNPSNELLADLIHGKLDLIVISKCDFLDENIVTIPVLESNYLLVCSPNYSPSQKSNTKYIAPSPISSSGQTFNLLVGNTENKIETVGFNFAVELALCGAGMAFVPQYVVEQQIRKRELVVCKQFKAPVLEYYLCYNKNNLSNTLKEFLKYITKINS